MRESDREPKAYQRLRGEQKTSTHEDWKRVAKLVGRPGECHSKELREKNKKGKAGNAIRRSTKDKYENCILDTEERGTEGDP